MHVPIIWVCNTIPKTHALLLKEVGDAIPVCKFKPIIMV